MVGLNRLAKNDGRDPLGTPVPGGGHPTKRWSDSRYPNKKDFAAGLVMYTLSSGEGAMRGFRAPAIAILWAICGLWVRPAAHAQIPDPLAIDKVHYKLEVENQWVRAFREMMGPRETMTMHQHPQPGAVIIFLTDRYNRLTSPEGAARELRDHAGDVMWAPASAHRSENLTDAPFEAVQIEPRRPAGTPHPFTVDKKMDAAVVDPEHYHVELDNEYARVLRVTIGPHEKLRLHNHPDSGAVLVYLTDQNMRITLADGTMRPSRYAAKTVRWVEAGPAHQDENLSDAPLRFIRVELK